MHLDERIGISSVLHSVLSILYGYKFIIAILLELYVYRSFLTVKVDP